MKLLHDSFPNLTTLVIKSNVIFNTDKFVGHNLTLTLLKKLIFIYLNKSGIIIVYTMININKKILLLYLITSIISCKMLYNYNLFGSLIAVDNLIGACSWMLSYFNKNINYTDVVTNAQVYNNSALDRYISYGLCYVSYTITTTFFWTRDIPILHYLMFLLPIPEIINNFIQSDVYNKINNIKKILIKTIIAKNIVLGIKTASKTYINKEVDVKYKEIIPLLSDYDKSVNIAKNITKNLLIVLLMSYIKKYAPKWWYRASKYALSYKMGNKMESFNVNGARSKLVNIIDEKRWDELLKPEFIKSILYVYQEHVNNSDDVIKIMITANITFSGMLVIWTICSFFKYSWIAPIISIIMVLYRKEYGTEMYNKLIVLSLILGSSFWTNNYLVISLLSQFGYFVIFNRVNFLVCKNLAKNVYKWILKLINKNNMYNKMLLTTIFYSIVLKKVINTELVHKIIGVNIFYNLITNPDNKFNIIYTIIMLTAMFSESIIHIIYNGVLIYVLVGLLNRDLLSDLKYIVKKIIGFVLECISNKPILGNLSKFSKESVKNTQKTLPINLIKDTSSKLLSNKSNDNISEIDLKIFELPQDKFLKAIAVKDPKNVDVSELSVTHNIYIIEDYDHVCECTNINDNCNYNEQNKSYIDDKL